MSTSSAPIRWNGWGPTAHREPPAREAVWRWLAGQMGMPALMTTPARPLEDVALPPPRLSAGALQAFRDAIGPDRVRQDDSERAFHARGRSYHDLVRLRSGDLADAPDAVLYPRGEEEVAALLAIAARHGVALIPFGGGTGVVGGVTAGPGMVSLDMRGMNRILGVDHLARTARFEAGILGPALENALRAEGLTLGHYPQSFEFSTLGGWIAHHGSGQESGVAGRAADWLAGVRLATPAGILASSPAPASAAGPDLKAMVLGSEGTLGVITEATVRVRPLPAPPLARAYLFRDLAAGMAAMRQALQAGVPHVMLRLSDAAETHFHHRLRALESNAWLWQAATDRLLAWRGFDDRACVMLAAFPDKMAARRFGLLAKTAKALPLGAAPVRAWQAARFQAGYRRDALLDRGLGVETLETAAPWSALPALHEGVRAAALAAMAAHAPLAGAHGLALAHLSHAYQDGASLYFTLIFPRKLDGEIDQWRAIKAAATEAVLGHGGTVSHHHGVGQDHLPWMAREKGAAGLAALRGLKKSLDPGGILNPGKLIPPA